MLLALHAGIAWGVEHGSARGFLLAHFGLFLLWQPLWRGEREIAGRQAALVVGAGMLLALVAGWWVLALWLAMMFGLLGGRATSTSDRRTRAALVLAAVYVLALLLAWVVPHLFSAWQPEELLTPAVRYVLPLLPAAIVFMPVPADASGRKALAIDLFYAVVLFLLVIALVLGSFVLKDVAQGRYAYALMLMLFALAAVLAALSWLWNPHDGYAGLGQLLSRYLVSVGLPFERWIEHLAQLADRESDAHVFVEEALGAMVSLRWVSGAQWSAAGVTADKGTPTAYRASWDIRGQRFDVHVRSRLTPGLAMHLKLLAEVLAYFYEAKRREEAERVNAYERAIHETGARLTHDMKNLLQALRSLCAAARESGVDDEEALLALMRRQLPQLTDRVSVTLEKLRVPTTASLLQTSAVAWWEGLKLRYEGRGVEFECGGIDPQLQVPGELFDRVAENLIDNALRKAPVRPRVQVAFHGMGGTTLAVSDDGMPVPQDVARSLLRQRVSSSRGLGVGLYQCAAQAAQLGYRLSLAANRAGEVKFVLSRA
ncbi:MAG TPA: ATP-binding protein [Burkholderiales bacterium]